MAGFLPKNPLINSSVIPSSFSKNVSENPLLVMCTRIHEPLFIPKGDNGQCSFKLPNSFFLEKYRKIIEDITNFIGDLFSHTLKNLGIQLEEIQISDLTRPLDLSKILQLPRNENFSIFTKKHQECSDDLCRIFMEASNISEFMSRLAFCRDRVNSQMFLYCAYVCMLHRKDCKHLPLPKLWETFPEKFLDCSTINSCKETATIVPPGKRLTIEIPEQWTATNVEPEQLVAYWREDVGINLHHWHWHLIYPPFGLKQFVDKPKRGELNYYMHHQIMARYNTERYCNKLAKTRPFDFNEAIPEAYFSKLTESNSGKNLPSRPVDMKVTDIHRPGDSSVFTIAQMEQWKTRIFQAIETMSIVLPNGTRQKLDEHDGINHLVNLVESCSLSLNPDYYGDFHNNGHVMLAFIHDPDNRFLEGGSAMGDPATAMRDPVFYRWHELINNVCAKYKDKLPSYSVDKLNFPGVTVTSLSLETENANPNLLYTHMVESAIDVSRGLDFTRKGSVFAAVTHLDHVRFKYLIKVQNNNPSPVMATVRIFMAPKVDDNDKPLSQNEQRMLMIEMDKKVLELKPGSNDLTIDSYESSVCIPWETTFQKAELRVPLVFDAEKSTYSADRTCGCGWPLHMLVPKGREKGFPMDLFVMLSNYELDKADHLKSDRPGECKAGVSYCGLQNEPWPEKRSMGYPFDRVARPGVQTMQDFLTSNMKIQPITIYFVGDKKDIVKSGPQNRSSNVPTTGQKDHELLGIEGLLKNPGSLITGIQTPVSKKSDDKGPLGSALKFPF